MTHAQTVAALHAKIKAAEAELAQLTENHAKELDARIPRMTVAEIDEELKRLPIDCSDDLTLVARSKLMTRRGDILHAQALDVHRAETANPTHRRDPFPDAIDLRAVGGMAARAVNRNGRNEWR
jgi:hypothetical protein